MIAEQVDRSPGPAGSPSRSMGRRSFAGGRPLAAVAGLLWLLLISVPYVQVAWTTLTRRGTTQRPNDFGALDAAPILVVIFGLALLGLLIGAGRRPWLSRGFGIVLLGLAGVLVMTVLTGGGAAWPFAVVVGLVVLGAAAGGRLLDWLFTRGGGPTGLERGTFSVALAFGLASHATFGLGLLGLLYWWLVAAVLAGVVIVVRRDLKVLLAGARGRVAWVRAELTIADGHWFGLPLFALLAGWGLLVFVHAVAPEIWYDGLNYHLALPDLYAEQHAIVPTPHRVHSYFPLGTEMVYLLAIVLGGQIAAKLVSVVFAILTAVGIFAFSARAFSPRAGLAGAALFVTTPLVAWEASGAFADLALACYCFFAVAAVYRWLEERADGWLVVAGLMAGFALSTKLNALFLIASLGLVFLAVVLADRRRSWAGRLRACLCFGMAALVSGAPWPLFRWVQTGNPVFPFYNAIFRSPLWPATNGMFNFGQFGLGTSPASLLQLPWAVTFRGEAFTEGQPGSVLGLALLTLPLLALARVRGGRRGVLLLGAVVLLFGVPWAMTAQFLRYAFPVLPILMVLAGVALAGAGEPNGLPRWARPAVSVLPRLAILAWVVAGLPLFLSMFGPIRERVPYRVALGLEPRSAYLSRTVGVFDAFQYLNERSPGRQTHVLAFTGEEAHLYADATVESMYSPFLIPLLEVRDPAELVAVIRARGFTHVVVNRQYPAEQLARYVAAQRAFLRQHAELEHEVRKVEVYRLRT